MKKYRSSVIAACILIVMLICWFTIDRISVKNKYNKEGERTEIINLEQADIEEIVFENSGEKFTLVNNGTDFVIKERNIKADSYAINILLASIMKIDGKLLVRNCKDIAQYGLDNPKSIVSVKTHGKYVTLTLGDLTPSETEYYLMDDNNDVYSIYTDAGSGLDSKRWQFMDLNLFSTSYDDVKTVLISGEDEFSAERETTGDWKIKSKNDGDYEASDEKFRANVGLYFENMYAKRLVINNEENRRTYGLDSPEGIVTIISKNGNKSEFKIYRDKEKKEAAVIKNDGEDIFITIDSYFDMLDIKKDNLI